MGRKFIIFALFYFVFESKFQVQAPRGAYIRRSDLTEGFLRYDFEGGGGAYIWRGLYMEGLIFGILRYFYNSLNSLQSMYKIPRALLENMYPVILERGFRGNTV